MARFNTSLWASVPSPFGVVRFNTCVRRSLARFHEFSLILLDWIPSLSGRESFYSSLFFVCPCLSVSFLSMKKCNYPVTSRFTATREIRNIEKKVNEDIASGKASSDMFGNVAVWHTPVLAMTADVIQATSEACMACGMDGYVAKPFEEEKLYSAVARFFESDGGTRI